MTAGTWLATVVYLAVKHQLNQPGWSLVGSVGSVVIERRLDGEYGGVVVERVDRRRRPTALLRREGRFRAERDRPSSFHNWNFDRVSSFIL